MPPAISASTTPIKINCPISDSDVEEQQRQRNRILRQADLGQRARETQPVQQPERERHDPRIALRESGPALPAVHDLGRDEDDAECDQRLDRRYRARAGSRVTPGASVML